MRAIELGPNLANGHWVYSHWYLTQGLYVEATLFAVACATEDKKEGTTAFLEKRAPQFKGK